MLPPMPLALRLSRWYALLVGIFCPVGETIRRWGHIDYLPAFLDDYAIGALLLAGVWASRRDDARGVRLLCAAWGFACGIGYSSFFGHLRAIDQPDVGPLPQVWLTTLIGAGWALSLVAMFISVRGERGTSVPRPSGP
jgi:hypothetical protein